MKNKDLLINIENQIEAICAYECGEAIIEHVLKDKFGVKDIYELHPSSYQELFHELFDIEVDLN